jgi:hypothetical protein
MEPHKQHPAEQILERAGIRLDPGEVSARLPGFGSYSAALRTVAQICLEHKVSKSQRAAIASEVGYTIKDLLSEETRKFRRGLAPPPEKPEEIGPRISDSMAELFHVGVFSIGIARQIKIRDASQFELALRNEITIWGLYKKLKEKDPGSVRSRNEEALAQYRLVSVLSQIKGLCMALTTLAPDIPRSLKRYSRPKALEWAVQAEESVGKIGTFAQQIRANVKERRNDKRKAKRSGADHQPAPTAPQ